MLEEISAEDIEMRWFFIFRIILLVSGATFSVCGAANARAEITLGKIIFKIMTRGTAIVGERAVSPAARRAAQLAATEVTGGTLAIAFISIGYGDVTVDTAHASNKPSPSIDISSLKGRLKTKANRCVLSYGKDGKCWPCAEEHGSPSCKIIDDEDAISITCDGDPCKATAIEQAAADGDVFNEIKFIRPELKPAHAEAGSKTADELIAAIAEAAKGTKAAGDTKPNFPVKVLCFSKDGAAAQSGIKTVAERVEKTLQASGAQTDLGYSDFREFGGDQVTPGVLRILYSDEDEAHYKTVREALENKFGFLTIESRKTQAAKGLQVLLAL